MILLGGSAGSRQSMLLALRRPELISGLFLFWISGGAIGLSVAGRHYCGHAGLAATRGGMAAVAALPIYRESLERNPLNRKRLMAQDPGRFCATMQAWTAAFFPTSGSPVPGHSLEDLAALNMPVMILAIDEKDPHHTGETTRTLAEAILGSRLVEPAWGPGEWHRRLAARDERGEDLFASCPQLAGQALDFFGSIV